MKKDISLHYQKTNKMEILNNIKSAELQRIWNELYEFQKTTTFKTMNLKDKRDFQKIEDKLWKIYKNYYHNDLLQQENNTVERTIDI